MSSNTHNKAGRRERAGQTIHSSASYDLRRSSAQTMRIDIDPEDVEPSIPDKPSQRTIDASPSFIVRRESVRQRSEDYSKLLQSVYDGVLITDLSGRIIDLNARAAEFFMRHEDELAGTPAMDLMIGADESLLDSILNNLREHRFTLIEARCLRKDQTTFPAEIAVNKIDLDSEGQLCFFVRDISVRKSAQDALEDAVSRLEAHDRARSQFVSNVSHELRTPLSSMIYAVNNLLRGVAGDVSDRVRRYLEMLEGDCKRLLGTVNDILDIRKLEDKSLVLLRSKTPIAYLVKSCVESLHALAERKAITLNVEGLDRQWFVDCDAPKMERVIVNILGNAIKFTPDNGRIDVLLDADVPEADFLRISIQDSGIGIPPEALEKVTLRYFTVGEQPSGSGLGLAIAKELVALHGGSLAIQSPPPEGGKGTVVRVNLPVVKPARALVVDDDRLIVELIAAQLKQSGYDVIPAYSCADGLRIVREQKPDIVLLDLELPDMSGMELLLKIKSDKALMKMPLVVVSGIEVEPPKREILRRFSIPLLAKPWDNDELVDLVAEALIAAGGLRTRPH